VNPTSKVMNNDFCGEGLQELQQTPQDQRSFAELQHLLTDTHKPYDNWTRDRGCRIHHKHLDKCSEVCAYRNIVPRGFVLRRAFRNHNAQLWGQYMFAKTAISQDCARAASVEFSYVPALSSFDLDSGLSTGCNEWRLLHGTSEASARNICSSGFEKGLVGTGGSLRSSGRKTGVPMFGSGVYAAERITKADEYAAPTFDSELHAHLNAVLLLRCVGGRVKVMQTKCANTTQMLEEVRMDVHMGPCHSLVFDGHQKLGKPYREFVIYDERQCFPEFLLLYNRKF